MNNTRTPNIARELVDIGRARAIARTVELLRLIEADASERAYSSTDTHESVRGGAYVAAKAHGAIQALADLLIAVDVRTGTTWSAVEVIHNEGSCDHSDRMHDGRCAHCGRTDDGEDDK